MCAHVKTLFFLMIEFSKSYFRNILNKYFASFSLSLTLLCASQSQIPRYVRYSSYVSEKRSFSSSSLCCIKFSFSFPSQTILISLFLIIVIVISQKFVFFLTALMPFSLLFFIEYCVCRSFSLISENQTDEYIRSFDFLFDSILDCKHAK